MPKYSKGKKIRVKTTDGQIISGTSLGVDEAYWGRKRKPEKTLRIEQRDSIIAIPLRNIR